MEEFVAKNNNQQIENRCLFFFVCTVNCVLLCFLNIADGKR